MKWYEIEIAGLRRRLPVVEVSEGVRIASNARLVLGDIEFCEKVAEELAKRMGRVDVIVCPESKAICLGAFLCRRAGVKEMVIARKSIKAYMQEPISVRVRSITTKGEQLLVLDSHDVRRIRGKRVALFDDVISTGGTMKGLLELVEKAGGKVKRIVTVWLEGPWPWKEFGEYIKSGKLVYLDTLPVMEGRG